MNTNKMLIANVQTKPSAGITRFNAKGVSTKSMFLPQHLKPLHNKTEGRPCNDFEQLAYIGRFIAKRNGNIPKQWDKDIVDAAIKCNELEQKGQHTKIEFIGESSKLWTYSTIVGGN